MTVLQAQSLSLTKHGRPLIEGINLEFHPGTLYGILGPNGAGKTSFLKTLAGIWMPTSGAVLWKGENLLQKNRKQISKTISLVPQNPQVHFDILVDDFVAMGRYPHLGQGESATKTSEIVEASLVKVGGAYLKSRLITELSSGERQLVYIARALASESPVILLDEPTASLDIKHQWDIWNILKDLSKQGKTVIATLHDLSAARRFCDSIALLHGGKHIAAGSYTEIMQPDIFSEIFGLSLNPKFSDSLGIKELEC